jgi:hypothetical protein
MSWYSGIHDTKLSRPSSSSRRAMPAMLARTMRQVTGTSRGSPVLPLVAWSTARPSAGRAVCNRSTSRSPASPGPAGPEPSSAPAAVATAASSIRTGPSSGGVLGAPASQIAASA